MRQWVVICDRCGKEIQGDPMGLFLCMTDRDIPGVSVGDTDHSYDICDDCMAEVIKFMEHGRMGTTLQKADNPDDISIGDTMLPVPPEEKDNKAPETGQQSDMPQKKRKHVDRGKLLALRNVGWSIDKIADEMGLTNKQVSNHLYLAKKEIEKEEVRS